MPEPEVPDLAPPTVPPRSPRVRPPSSTLIPLALVLGIPIVGVLLLAVILGRMGRSSAATHTVTFLAWFAALFLGLALLLSTALTLFDRTAWSRHAALRLPAKGVVSMVALGVLASLAWIPSSMTVGAIALVAGVATLPFALRESELLRIPAMIRRRGAPLADAGVARRIADGDRRFLRVAFGLALASVAVWGSTWLPLLQEWIGHTGVPLFDLYDRPPFPTTLLFAALPLVIVVHLQVTAMARSASTQIEAERRLAQRRGLVLLALLVILVAAATGTMSAASESLLARRSERVKRSVATWLSAFQSATSKGCIDPVAFESAKRSAVANGLPAWLEPAAWRIGTRRTGPEAEREEAASGSCVLAFPIGSTFGLGGSRHHYLILAPTAVDPLSVDVPEAHDPATGRQCTSIGYGLPEQDGHLAWIRMTSEFR